MKNTKFLTPLSYTSRELVKNERKSGFRSEDLSENPQRLNRDNLKHYLSTNQIKTPLHSIKKKFELTVWCLYFLHFLQSHQVKSEDGFSTILKKLPKD